MKTTNSKNTIERTIGTTNLRWRAHDWVANDNPAEKYNSTITDLTAGVYWCPESKKVDQVLFEIRVTHVYDNTERNAFGQVFLTPHQARELADKLNEFADDAEKATALGVEV